MLPHVGDVPLNEMDTVDIDNHFLLSVSLEYFVLLALRLEMELNRNITKLFENGLKGFHRSGNR